MIHVFLKKTSDVLLLRKERRQNYRKYYNQKHFYILKIDGLWGSTTYQFQYFLIICLLIVKTWRYDREGDPALLVKSLCIVIITRIFHIQSNDGIHPCTHILSDALSLSFTILWPFYIPNTFTISNTYTYQ